MVAYIGLSLIAGTNGPVTITDVEVLGLPSAVEQVEPFAIDIVKAHHTIGTSAEGAMTKAEQAAVRPLDGLVLTTLYETRYQIIVGLRSSEIGVHRTKGGVRVDFIADGKPGSRIYPHNFLLRIDPSWCAGPHEPCWKTRKR